LSSGAVLPPLLNVICWYLGECEFYHVTGYWIIPPNVDVTLYYAPEEEDKVQVIFAITFGRPRDLHTGEVVYTDGVGFWHRGKGMKLHWDPIVESIIGVVYPHITPVTKRDYFEIRFLNRTDRTVVIDVSLWVFEYSKEAYEEFVKMVRGLANMLKRFSDAEALRGREATALPSR